jgi:hypothetical protein
MRMRLSAALLALACALASPAPARAALEVTVAPASYTTERGGDGGEPVAQLADQDQAGTEDDPTRYVRFLTPDASYLGERTFILPDEARAGALLSLTVRVSYRGPAKREQAWKWRIFDWQRGKFVKLGTNKAATADTWSVLTFAAKAKKKGGLARFVDPETGAVRLELRSGNDRADAFLDQEVLVLSVREPPSLGACTLFPADHYWNTPIDHLPVDERSNAYVASLGASDTVHPDFGAGLWQGAPIGIPWTSVGAGQPLADVSFYYEDSDAGPYPIPPDAPIEGGPKSRGDRHVLVVDNDACRLYEMFDAHPKKDGSWEAGSGAVFDLASNALRPDGWTSADAAGFAILPGLVRYDEIAAGEIPHALRFTAADIRNAYVWPARHRATCGGHGEDDLSVPPMGQRFRLKASFDTSGYSQDVQVILTAMKRYGIVLADCGSSWYVSGAPDDRFDHGTLLAEMHSLTGADFEAVDTSSLMIDPDSAAANPPPP